MRKFFDYKSKIEWWSKMERRKRRREEKERAILEAAKALFLEKGLEAATMEELSQRAGLGKGTLYFYFKGKEEIALRLLSEGVGGLFEEMERVLASPLGPRDKLREFVKAFLKYYEGNKAFFRIFVFGRKPARELLPEEVFRSNAEKGSKFLEAFSKTVGEGIKEGTFGPIDPWKATVLGWAMIFGVLFLYEDEVSRGLLKVELEELMDFVFEFFLRGLRG